MSEIHAGPYRAPVPGQCSWRWHHEDVDLFCCDGIVPGEQECAEHYIQRAQGEPRP